MVAILFSGDVTEIYFIERGVNFLRFIWANEKSFLYMGFNFKNIVIILKQVILALKLSFKNKYLITGRYSISLTQTIVK